LKNKVTVREATFTRDKQKRKENEEEEANKKCLKPLGSSNKVMGRQVYTEPQALFYTLQMTPTQTGYGTDDSWAPSALTPRQSNGILTDVDKLFPTVSLPWPSAPNFGDLTETNGGVLENTHQSGR